MRVALPVAAMIGIGLASGGAGFAAAPGTVGTFGSIGTYGGMATGSVASSGGFLSGLFSAKGASMAMSGFSALTSLVGGMQQARDAKLLQAQERRRIEMLELQAKQTEANLSSEHRRSRAAAIAQAAAQGWAPHQSQSMRAFLETEEEEFGRRRDTIKAQAKSGIDIANINVTRYGQRANTAIASSVLKAGRSLLGGYKKWNET